MNLDEGQKRKVTEWIEQGLKLSEIQAKLGSELGVSMTYMDVRLLIDDLKLRPKDPAPVARTVMNPASPLQAPGAPATPPGSPAAPFAGEPKAAAEGVSVTVDSVARPGALVSGGVTFTDGKSAQWYLDQTGRLGLVAKEQGYRPSPEDVAEFQTRLQEELAKLGL